MVEETVETFNDELARRLLCLPPLVEYPEGRDDIDGGELEEVGYLLEWLLSFFLSQATSSALTCRTLVSFKPAGRTQLQSKPSNKVTNDAIRIRIVFKRGCT